MSTRPPYGWATPFDEVAAEVNGGWDISPKLASELLARIAELEAKRDRLLAALHDALAVRDTNADRAYTHMRNIILAALSGEGVTP